MSTSRAQSLAASLQQRSAEYDRRLSQIDDELGELNRLAAAAGKRRGDKKPGGDDTQKYRLGSIFSVLSSRFIELDDLALLGLLADAHYTVTLLHFSTIDDGASLLDVFNQLLLDPILARKFREEGATLPPAALRARELPIPRDLIESPDYSARLANEKLIHAGLDTTLIALVEKTWIDFCNAPQLSAHSAMLSSLQQSADPEERSFYLRIMAGHHRSALWHMRKSGPPGRLTIKACLDIILVQTLIFNARDVQSTIADIQLALVQPAYGLVAPAEGYIRASGLTGVFKKVAETAERCLRGYMTRPERDAHRCERIAARKPGKPVPKPRYATPKGSIAKTLAPVVEARLAKMQWRMRVKLRRQLDHFIEFAREKLASSPHLFPSMPVSIEGSSDKNGNRKTVDLTKKLATGARYSGLSPLECSAVSICRFVHSAIFLSQAFEHAATVYALTGQLPYNLDGQLPGFDKSKMPRGAKNHIKLLLDSYRRVILEDSAFGAKSGRRDPIASFDNQGVAPVDAAIEWLSTMGPRVNADHSGDINDERRTFYLLDVLPDIRLSR